MKILDVINESKLIHHVWEKIHDNKLKHAKCKRCKCEKYFDDRWGKVIFIDRFGKTHHHHTPDCVLPNTKLNETKEISAIKKDKDKEIFDYHSISTDAWHELLQDAQKIQKINFATENDDSTGEKKTFYVKKNLRKDQPVKYQFDAELMEAGGDWECPVMYFRVQFTHDNFYGNIYKNNKDNPKYAWDVDRKTPKLYKCYVVIPPVEAGNKLTNQYEESSEGDKDNDKWFAYQNNELSKEDEKKARITDADKKSVWKWLEELLDKLVEDNHEMLDENIKPKLSLVEQSELLYKK